MTNTELTLDQLIAVSGGLKQRDDGRGCTEPNFFEWVKAPWCWPTGDCKELDSPSNTILGSADTGLEDV